ncbi:ABC transporter permease [Alkaliphilus crotonatoxidans]
METINFYLYGLLNRKLPIGEAIEAFINFLTTNFRGFFRTISDRMDSILTFLESKLLWFPPIVLMVIVALLGYWLAGRKKSVGILSFLGLYIIYNLQLWEPTISTTILVLISTLISILIGIPLGILTARNTVLHKIVMPLMDLMQTMPAFVYLIPAVSLFNIGRVPGVFATVIFSIPPSIRLTSLGIRQVPSELIEASDAFGSTTMQKLIKVQLPLALSTIMAGVNQTIMLALSMVVISAMIGAGGLGRNVWYGIQRLQLGSAFEAGIAVVILAIILDRITQNIAKQNKKI